MRVGFNLGPPAVIDKMTNIKEGSTLNTPKYNQDMCTAFLTNVDLEAYFKRCCAYYGDKLSVFLNALAEHFPPERSVTWTQPEGGMFLWISMPQVVDTHELFHAALKFKVAFVPGGSFFVDGRPHSTMRLNFSNATPEQIEEGIRRLSLIIRRRLEALND